MKNIENEIAAKVEQVTRWIAKRLRNAADVEDVAQDVMLRALASKDRIEGNVDAFLFRLAINAIADHFRGIDQAVPLNFEPADEETDWSDDTPPSRLIARLHSAARGSGADARRAMRWARLHWVEGLSYTAIARRDKVSANTVKSALKALRERARKTMKRWRK